MITIQQTRDALQARYGIQGHVAIGIDGLDITVEHADPGAPKGWKIVRRFGPANRMEGSIRHHVSMIENPNFAASLDEMVGLKPAPKPFA